MVAIPSIPRILTIVLAMILVSRLCSFAQSDRTQAIESPLSTAIYLLSKTAKDDRKEEKVCLAKSLVRANRIKDLEVVAKGVEAESYVYIEFTAIAEQLIKDGREKEASAFVSYLLNRIEGDDSYYLKSLVRPIILLKRDDELSTLIGKLDESDQVELWFKASDIYRELGKTEKALSALKKTVKVSMTSEYPNDRAALALGYAKLGREAEATELLRTVSRELDPKTRSLSVVFDLADAYKALGRYSEANELERVYNGGADIDDVRDLVSIASSLVAKGDRQTALDTLADAITQLDPKEYGDSFNLGNIIELYLRLGEVRRAEKAAMGLSGSDYMQQRQLLAVADRYAKTGNKTKARKILRFALGQTYRIDTSEAESGSLWTSGKWDQARYQSQMALRLIDMQFDREALLIVSHLKKPYLRALALTEYVAVNRKRTSSKKMSLFLEEAVTLLRQRKTDVFDSRKFDVLAIAARNLAEIGMAERANAVFAETLKNFNEEVVNGGSERSLVFGLCNIGVEFERSNIKADEGTKAALRLIIQNWEEGKY